MATPDDAVPVQESQTFSKTAETRRSDPSDPVSLAQEINERRARVENPELLQQLRGL